MSGFASGPLLREGVNISAADLAGLAALAGYAGLAWYSLGTFEEPRLSVFYSLILWVCIPVGVAWACASKTTVLNILVWALLFRLCGLFGFPLFEDDFYRYLWDGYLFVEFGTPYGFLPMDFFAADGLPVFAERLLDGINYPDLPTIYGPVDQFIFALSYLALPGSLLPLQVILIGFDLALIVLLSQHASRRNLLLYAWCPLVIKEIAFTAHPDIIGILFLVLALHLVCRRAAIAAGIFLALATGAKVFALLLAPFVLYRCGPRGWTAFLLTLAALYLPFLVQGSSEFTSLFVFASEWQFNASLFAVLAGWMPGLHAKIVLGAVFAGALLHFWNQYRQEKTETMPRGDIIFGLFLLVAPVVNPWYVIWVLPFAVIYPSIWAWTASVAALLAYITALNLGDLTADPFSQPVGILLLEYGIVTVALGLDLYFRFRPRITDAGESR